VRHGAPLFFLIEGVDARREIACRQTPDHFDPEAVVAEQLIAKANDSCLPTSNSALGCHPHLQAHVQHWANRAARARAGTDTLVEGHEQSVDIQPILTGSSVSSAAFGYGLTGSPMRLITMSIAKPALPQKPAPAAGSRAADRFNQRPGLSLHYHEIPQEMAPLQPLALPARQLRR